MKFLCVDVCVALAMDSRSLSVPITGTGWVCFGWFCTIYTTDKLRCNIQIVFGLCMCIDFTLDVGTIMFHSF